MQCIKFSPSAKHLVVETTDGTTGAKCSSVLSVLRQNSGPNFENTAILEMLIASVFFELPGFFSGAKW